MDVAFASANGDIYVTNEHDWSVSVINTLTNTVVGSPITVGKAPWGVAFAPSNNGIYVANYGDDTVSFISVLVVSVSPGSATLDVGQSQLFTATPSGGSGSYTGYQWYVNGVAQSGQTASTFSFAPGSAGAYSITATVTDSSSTTSAQSTAASVSVYSVLVAPTASASRTAVIRVRLAV